MSKSIWISFVSSTEELGDVATSSKRRVTEEDLVKDDLKKSRVEDDKKVDLSEEPEQQSSTSDEVKQQGEEAKTEEDSGEKEFTIGTVENPQNHQQ